MWAVFSSFIRARFSHFSRLPAGCLAFARLLVAMETGMFIAAGAPELTDVE